MAHQLEPGLAKSTSHILSISSHSLRQVLQNMVDTDTVVVQTAANPAGGVTGPLRVDFSNRSEQPHGSLLQAEPGMNQHTPLLACSGSHALLDGGGQECACARGAAA